MIKAKFGIREIKYIAFLLYAISISAFGLGTGFDAIFNRTVFIFMLMVCLYSNGLRLIVTLHLKWCVVFWGIYYLSVFWTHSISDTMSNFNDSIQIIGMAVCMPIIIHDKEDVDKCIEILVLSGVVMIVRLILLTPVDYFGIERIGESIGIHSNGVGHRMAMLVTMTLYLFGKRYREKQKITLYGIMCIILIIIFTSICLLTGSKGSIMKLIICMTMYILLMSKGPKVLLRIIFIALAIYVLFWLIMNNDMLYDLLGKRLENLVATVFIGERNDTSTLAREWFIEQAKELFRNYPILGYGGNNFQTYLKSINYWHITSSHNGIYELLSTLGIVGFISYFLILLKLEFELINKWHRENSSQKLLFAILIFVLFINEYIQVNYVAVFSQNIIALAFMANRYSTDKQNITDRRSMKYAKGK